MISINKLIDDACKKLNLVGDNESASGSLVLNALTDLHSLISELNEDNFISEWQKEFFINGSDKLTLDFDPLPSRIVSISRKVGSRYQRLIPSNKEFIYSKTRQGLPTTFTTDIVYDEVDDKMKMEILLDGNSNCEFLIIYQAGVPNYDINDKVILSDRYLTLLDEGLCVKLCERYKLYDFLEQQNNSFETIKTLIKRSNSNNRPLVYDNFGGSYMDSFYDGLAGNGF